MLLERALALDPTYGLAHGYAAQCHHSIFLRGGLNAEHRAAAIRHAQAAIAHGQDDALLWPSLDLFLALTRTIVPLPLPHSMRPSPLAHRQRHLYLRQRYPWLFAEKPNERPNGPNVACGLARSILGVPLPSFHCYWTFSHGDMRKQRTPHGRPSKQSGFQYCPIWCWLRRWQSSAGSKRPKTAAARLLGLHPVFRYSRFISSVNCESELAASIGEALRDAGLPE